MQSTLSDLELLSMHLSSGTSLRSALEKAPIRFEKSAIYEKTLWEETLLNVDKGELPAISCVGNYIRFLEIQNTLTEEFNTRIRMPRNQSLVLFFLTLASILGNSFLLPPVFQTSLELQLGSLCWVMIGHQVNSHFIQHSKKKLWKKDWLFFLEEIRMRLQSGSTLRVAIMKSLEAKKRHALFPQALSTFLDAVILECRDPAQRAEPESQSELFLHRNPLVGFHLHLLIQSLREGVPVTDAMKSLCERLSRVIRWEMQKITDQLGLWLLGPLFLFYLPAVLFLWLSPFLIEAQKALVSM
jgi:hypothetical protein